MGWEGGEGWEVLDEEERVELVLVGGWGLASGRGGGGIGVGGGDGSDSGGGLDGLGTSFG